MADCEVAFLTKIRVGRRRFLKRAGVGAAAGLAMAPQGVAQTAVSMEPTGPVKPGARLAQTKLNLQAFRNLLRNPPPYRAAVLTDQEVADLFAYIQSFPAPEPAGRIPLLKD